MTYMYKSMREILHDLDVLWYSSYDEIPPNKLVIRHPSKAGVEEIAKTLTNSAFFTQVEAIRRVQYFAGVGFSSAVFEFDADGELGVSQVHRKVRDKIVTEMQAKAFAAASFDEDLDSDPREFQQLQESLRWRTEALIEMYRCELRTNHDRCGCDCHPVTSTG